MDAQKKANELINKHGAEVAHEIADGMLTEIQDGWNQEKIDFWLDVKLVIDKSKNK